MSIPAHEIRISHHLAIPNHKNFSSKTNFYVQANGNYLKMINMSDVSYAFQSWVGTIIVPSCYLVTLFADKVIRHNPLLPDPQVHALPVLNHN